MGSGKGREAAVGQWRGLRTRGGVPGSVPAARRASQAARPGRGGCERAPPPCPLRSARLSGEAPPRAPGSPQPQSRRPWSFVRRRGSESHLLAAGRRGRGRRGGGAERGGGRSPRLPLPAPRRPPPGGSAVPAPGLRAPPAPGPASRAHRGSRSRSPSSPARPVRPPPPGAAGELEASAGRGAPPGCAREPPRRASPAEEPERSGRPAGRAGGSAAAEREPASEAERAQSRRGSRHHAGLEEEHPHLLAGGRAGAR